MSDGVRFERRMSDADAMLWRLERDPLLRSTITSVSIYDRPFDRARLAERMERATRLIPRLRQRVLGSPLSPSPPRWLPDARFDLDDHLRWTEVGGTGTMRDLLDLVEPLAVQPFDRDRPLWDFTVVEGLEGGRCAFVQKIHHAVTDGVGGMQLAMLTLDLERDPAGEEERMPPAPAGEDPGVVERLLDAAGHERRRAMGLARRQAGAVRALAADPVAAGRRAAGDAASIARLLAPTFEPLSPLLRARSAGARFDTVEVPLADLKAAARKADGKLNDAFVAAVTGGFRRYHERHGQPVEQLRMTMPINARTEQTADVAGNHLTPARLLVPAGMVDPVARMRRIHDLVAEQRDEPAGRYTEVIAGILNRLPAVVSTELLGRMLKGVDFLTSNVPGAPVPVFMAGARLEAQYPFGPLGGAAVNVTLLSHLDTCLVGINSDPAAVADPVVLRDCIAEGFDEVCGVAS